MPLGGKSPSTLTPMSDRPGALQLVSEAFRYPPEIGPAATGREVHGKWQSMWMPGYRGPTEPRPSPAAGFRTPFSRPFRLGRVESMPNEEYLDSSVHWKVRTGQIAFAEPTHNEVADAIEDAGLATDVGQRLGSGKEADVYLCRDRARLVAVKVYRQYRTAHRGGRPIKLETMGQRALQEFDLLDYTWQGGGRVPKPGQRVENMFSMQYLGSAAGPAPMLQHAELSAPEEFLRATEDGIVALAQAGVVHSDLSPFNILVHEDEPWFIDLAAGIRVDRLGTPAWVRLEEALQALRHGIGALQRHFRRYGLTLDGESLLERTRAQYDRFRVA
jgi:RIO kinase 1